MDRSKFTDILVNVVDVTKYFLLVLLIVIATIVIAGVPLMVRGESMMYNFQNGEVVVVEKITYIKDQDIKRGDVIAAKFPADPDKTRLIKRIVAMPGETVESHGGLIYVNDKLLDENIYNPIVGNPPYQEIDKITLKSDEYFVCGDNRPGSSDSRLWGPVIRKEDIQGRVAMVIFPIGKSKYIEQL